MNKTLRFTICVVISSILGWGFIFFHGLRSETVQTRISGRVTDATGAVVKGATVTLKAMAADKRWETQTNSSGAYGFRSMPTGGYVLRVEHPGFETAERNVLLEIDGRVRSHFVLRVDRVTRSIDVSDLTQVLVTVTDRNGRFVTDLDKKDFLLKENGREQSILKFCQRVATPLTLAVLIDSSLSVQPFLNLQKQSAVQFLERILREEDLAMIVKFDRDPALIQDLSNNLGELEQAVQAVTVGMGTSLHDAMFWVCSARLRKDAARKAIILFSDGDDTTSLHDFQQATEMAQRADVTVFPICYVEVDAPRDLHTLRKYARSSGGRVFSVKAPLDLKSAFQVIQEELNSQFNLSYQSSSPLQSRNFRRIEVTLPYHLHLKARVKKGYYAETFKVDVTKH